MGGARRSTRILTVVVASLVALEIGLRVYNPFPFRVRGDRIVLPVHQSYTISHAGAIKLDPVTHVRKNSLGFRGPDPPRDWSRWISVFTIGGSTTECLFLSDGKTWTDQLARRVNALRRDVWINNAGLEGHSTFGHLALLSQFIVGMRPTIAIFLFGVNDMKLASESPLDQALNPRHVSAAHRVMTFAADHAEIAAVGENLLRMARTYRADLGDGELHAADMRTRTIDEATRDRILDEHRAKYLGGYAQRVAEIVDVCRKNQIEPVLATQPALYGDVVDPTTGIALGSVAVAQATNGHVEWQVLELYNDVTRKVSADTGTLLIDLAREIPKDSKYFSDWIHFSNDGATLVGDVVFRRLEPRLASIPRP